MDKSLIENCKYLTNEEKSKILSMNLDKISEKSHDIVKILIKNSADYDSIICGIFLTDYRKNNDFIKAVK